MGCVAMVEHPAILRAAAWLVSNRAELQQSAYDAIRERFSLNASGALLAIAVADGASC